MFASVRLVCKLLAVWGALIYLAKMEEVGEKWGHSKVRCPEFTSSLVGWSGLRVIAEPRFKGIAKRKEGRRWWDVNLDQALC